MKNLTYIFSFCLISTLFNSCTSEKNLELNVIPQKIIFPVFNQFPEQPVNFLDFSLTTLENIQQLESFNYLSTQDFIYTQQKDSIHVLLDTEEKELNTFTLYLKSSFYLKQNKALFSHLTSNSNGFVGTSQFAEIWINDNRIPFKITYFSTPEFIRLSYSKLKTSP